MIAGRRTQTSQVRQSERLFKISVIAALRSMDVTSHPSTVILNEVSDLGSDSISVGQTKILR